MSNTDRLPPEFEAATQAVSDLNRLKRYLGEAFPAAWPPPASSSRDVIDVTINLLEALGFERRRAADLRVG